MTSSTKNRLRAILLLTYAVSVVASFLFCSLKLHALGYHTRDYPFYLQFAAKVFDPSLTNIYSINPYGYNAFGFDGIEGMSGLFQTIHLEPIKAAYGLVYLLFGSPLPIFFVFGLVYFAPPLYWGWRARSNTRVDSYFVLIVGLLYLLFPSSILAVADDLRPYTLLGPLLALTLLSIHLRSPRWHSALFLIAMLACREEALILAVFVIGYALIRSQTPSGLYQTAKIYGTIWLAWLLMTGAYYVWSAYPINPILNPLGTYISNLTYGHVLAGWVTIVCVYSGLIYCWTVMVRPKRQEWLAQQSWLHACFIAFIFVPLFRQVSVSKGRKFGNMPFEDALFSVFKDFMLYPKFTLIFIMVVVMLIMVWSALDRPAAKRGLCVVLTFLTFTCLYLQSVTWMKTPLVWQERYQQSREDSQLVWALRQNTDQNQTVILSDLATYQAFADYEHILVYERLPWAIEPSEARHYPTNSGRTVQILKDEVEYVVIAKEEESISAISELMKNANAQTLNIQENEHYQIMKITR